MKKKILLLMTMLVSFTVSQATEGYWVDVNFTRDSTMWIEAFPELEVSGHNLQCNPPPDGDYLGYTVHGQFGIFGGADYSYTPLNAENDAERFIYAFRLSNNDDSRFTFPEIDNAGKIKVHFLNGNRSSEAQFTLQKLVDEQWVEFDPEIKFDVPPHAYSTTSFVLEKDLNITDSVKLRLKGPTLRNVHMFSVSISKVTTTTEVVDVTNPSTGKTWMDRNLGASRVATSSDDDEAYGDLYQWGRDADGHQKLTSGTTEDLSDSDTPGHGDFIFAPGNNPGDWRSTLNNDLWQGVNGVNNPCPQGYRLPTQAELDEERESWGSNDLAGAFASPLKLPAAGRRMWNTGNIARSGLTGYYWSSTVNDHRIRNLDFSDSSANSNALNLRANGLSVRCIKEVVDDTGINTPDINKIKVYPVPASNQLTVSGLSGTASELQIVNVTGQTVKTIISSGAETPIDITDLQPGYYFIRAENRTLKFIKQ